MDGHSNLTFPTPLSTPADPKKNNHDETTEHNFSYPKEHMTSQQRSQRIAPKKPQRKFPRVHPSAKAPTNFIPGSSQLERSPEPQQTSCRSQIHCPSSQLPPPLPPRPHPPPPSPPPASSPHSSPTANPPGTLPIAPPSSSSPRHRHPHPLVPNPGYSLMLTEDSGTIPPQASHKALSLIPPTPSLRDRPSIPPPVPPSIPPPVPPHVPPSSIPSSTPSFLHPVPRAFSPPAPPTVPPFILHPVPHAETPPTPPCLKTSLPALTAARPSQTGLTHYPPHKMDLNQGSSAVRFDMTQPQGSSSCEPGYSQKLAALLQSADAPKGLNTSRLQPGMSFLLSNNKAVATNRRWNPQSSDNVPKPTDMKGMLLKLVNNKWKSRFFVLKSKFWTLEYYHSMSDYQPTTASFRGVYPLLGSHTSGLVEVKGGFQFIVTLRTSQMIQLKLPEKTVTERWRQSILATAQHPLPNFIGDAKNGSAQLVHARSSVPRNIRLNYMARYLYFYKQDRLEELTGILLKDAQIVMEKGSKKGLDITIKTKKEGQTVLRFQALENWVSWGTALESCVTP